MHGYNHEVISDFVQLRPIMTSYNWGLSAKF